MVLTRLPLLLSNPSGSVCRYFSSLRRNKRKRFLPLDDQFSGKSISVPKFPKLICLSWDQTGNLFYKFEYQKERMLYPLGRTLYKFLQGPSLFDRHNRHEQVNIYGPDPCYDHWPWGKCRMINFIARNSSCGTVPNVFTDAQLHRSLKICWFTKYLKVPNETKSSLINVQK